MEPLDSLNRLGERFQDRDRNIAFLRFIGRRALDDNLFQAAGALAYTTVFALVPLSMVVFGVLSAFPVFSEWSDKLTDYVFTNFVPTAASAVAKYLRELSDNAGQLTAAGVIALVASVLITLNGIEATFNRIWRVKSARPQVIRFMVYWTVLTLGAMLAAASFALSARFFALAIFSTETGHALQGLALRLSPMLIEMLAFTAIYRVVPHRTVHWRHALAGALIAALLFESIKSAFGLYLGSFNAYSKIYGALAFLPIFLLWIYLGWLSVLLGASVASAVSAFRYQPASLRLPEGYEIYGLLRLLGRFNDARREGQGLHSDRILELEPILTDDLVQQMLGQLESIDVVRRSEAGEWLLTRDLDRLTLADLYAACQLRIPVAEAYLPSCDDALGRSAIAAIDELRMPLRDLLKRRVGTIHADEED
ncbi:YihY family inner membrane protein [Marilutibacter maris]|uniref:UPF0761 membrane protein C9I47_2381 n=1 Tax=Marilutibacter maris TaxID=1605891 RepID=A0A2U9TEL3_9GAMM|nr:YihY family inner membrane protein [Lysobacter maris]AWV08059.1 ribonuclease BN [Lysobacter maris]KAB8198827.1 YihY family inner membrane protein [Lysobacter maris]